MISYCDSMERDLNASESTSISSGYLIMKLLNSILMYIGKKKVLHALNSLIKFLRSSSFARRGSFSVTIDLNNNKYEVMRNIYIFKINEHAYSIPPDIGGKSYSSRFFR
jgi:hypothetical protein